MATEQLDCPTPGLRRAIDAKAAAQQLGVSTGTVYKLLKQGKLQGYAVGRRRLVYEDDLRAFRLRNALGTPQRTEIIEKPTKPLMRTETVKKLDLPSRRHLR